MVAETSLDRASTNRNESFAGNRSTPTGSDQARASTKQSPFDASLVLLFSLPLLLLWDSSSPITPRLMADKRKLLDNPFIKLQRLHHYAAAQVIILAISWISRRNKEHKHVNTQISRELRLQGEKSRDELMSHLLSSDLCHNMIRMSPRAFLQLCETLGSDGGLRPTLQVSIEEQVAKTLYLLGHNVSHRELSFFFRRSRETVSRHFHNVLAAIIELEEKYLVQPDGSQVPSEIFNSSRFYPYFKDCVGAIDGTHIRVKVSNAEAPKYRGGKEYPTQNVLAACT